MIFILILYSFYTTFIQYSLHEQAILPLQQKFRHRKFLLLFVSILMSAEKKLSTVPGHGDEERHSMLS